MGCAYPRRFILISSPSGIDPFDIPRRELLFRLENRIEVGLLETGLCEDVSAVATGAYEGPELRNGLNPLVGVVGVPTRRVSGNED